MRPCSYADEHGPCTGTSFEVTTQVPLCRKHKAEYEEFVNEYKKALNGEETPRTAIAKAIGTDLEAIPGRTTQIRLGR